MATNSFLEPTLIFIPDISGFTHLLVVPIRLLKKVTMRSSLKSLKSFIETPG